MTEGGSVNTLITIASKQVWPQILLVARIRPEILILLHSGDQFESAIPAKRLKSFFQKTGLVKKGCIELEEISHDSYDAIIQDLSTLKVSPSDGLLNITGGNKLMILAASKWAENKGIPAVYLERGNQLVHLVPDSGRMTSQSEKIDPAITDNLSPLDLARCQLIDSEVYREGQRIHLNEKGKNLPTGEKCWSVIKTEDPLNFLTVEGAKDKQKKEGDRLEYLSALVLLKLGVQQVVRSFELKVKQSQGGAHAEIDLLFNYAGKLWIVDCKDRHSYDWVIQRVSSVLPPEDPALERVISHFSLSGMKEMKDDMLSASMTGGLRAGIICVRKTEFTETEAQYARDHQIAVASKKNLYNDMNRILRPGAKAGPEDLDDLKAHFKN